VLLIEAAQRLREMLQKPTCDPRPAAPQRRFKCSSGICIALSPEKFAEDLRVAAEGSCIDLQSTNTRPVR
jgi:hypothetical protein